MSLKDLDLKQGYDSGIDENILDEFYIPVLKEAKLYKRIAGFFSSTSLSIAAQGISGLIKNNGHMQLVVSPRLSDEDITEMELAASNPDAVIEKVLSDEIDNVTSLLQQKRLDAFGWMIAKGILEIKIAIVYDNNGKSLSYDRIEETGLFHSKVGIITDNDGNTLTFSGSINETASAWLRNIEEFKVFKDWDDGQKDSAEIDINKFDSYWNGKLSKVIIKNLPVAISEKLIHRTPKSIEQIEQEIAEEELKLRQKKYTVSFDPFYYQKEAFEQWKSTRSGLFAMATGTGKTKTAELCMEDVLNSTNPPVVIFIICPQISLVTQWISDISESGLPVDNILEADSNNFNWKNEIEGKILSLSVNTGLSRNYLYIFSTYNTFSSDFFINSITKSKKKATYFLIADEVHGAGAKDRAKGLLDIYDYKLGLSATPNRWYDETGTKLLMNFFNENTYEFSLERALIEKNPITHLTYLTPYDYLPKFVSLSEDELYDYEEKTKQIVRLMNKAETDEEAASLLERLTIQRANIQKSTKSKLKALEEILDSIKSRIENTIIFVVPDQLDDVIKILSKRHIICHPFTFKEKTKPESKYNGLSERDFILKNFKEGDYQVLVAIKCLDEGIDIPSASRAILMASSTNPREYIQRIGRVIRRYKNKDHSEIYDIIVKPQLDSLPPELKELEKRIFSKELIRIKEISNNASNKLEIINLIY